METYRCEAVWRGRCTGLKPGVYRIHSKFRRTINVLRGDSLVGVGTLGSLHLPITIIGNIPSSYDMRRIRSSRLIVEDSLLKAPPLELEVHVPPCDSKVPLISSAKASRLRQLILARLLSIDKGLSWYVRYTAGTRLNLTPYRRFILRRIKDLVGSLAAGDPDLAVGRLIGLGEGSTPSCDDLMMGVLVALHSKGLIKIKNIIIESMLRYAHNTTLLSRSLISCASRGYYCLEIVKLVSSEDPSPWMEKLITAGGTSGVDMLTGIFIGLNDG